MATVSDPDIKTGFRRVGGVSPYGAGAALRRSYTGNPGRQLHCLEAGLEQPGRPVYCLHATAYSGQSLAPLVSALGERRRAVAIDTPGYGGSDAPSAPQGVADYARAIADALDDRGEDQVDLFGYHTGAVIAAEMARQRPDLVRRMVLIGVPYFHGAEQAEWHRRLAEPMHLSEDFQQLGERWEYLVTNRPEGVTLGRAFENFVDELRAYPRGWWAHDAAFRFDIARCFADIRQQTLVLNPHNHLSDASRLAAAALPNGSLLEAPHLSNGIFDVAAAEIAEAIDAFLSGQDVATAQHSAA